MTAVLIEQRIRDVLRDGHRIEQPAFLKQNADLAADVEQLRFLEVGHVLAEQKMRPESGFTSPSAVFSSMVLPLPAAPSTTRVSPASISNDT